MIIGAGRLGTALGIALSSRGYAIEAVVARSSATARRSSSLIGPGTLPLSFTQLEKLPSSDIVFITTPDDAIEETSGTLAEQQEAARGRIALHASGALSSEVLGALRSAGFSTGSMHPLMSVSDPALGAERLRRAFFCIEGDARAKRVASSLVRAIGGKSFSIKSKDKALYHAAAVMASGHVVALFDVASEMLRSCGLSDRQVGEALVPLLQSTAENLSLHSPDHALTGTFARADAVTIEKHLVALKASGIDDAIAAYVLLGARSQRLARKAGAPSESLKQIERILLSERTRLARLEREARRAARNSQGRKR